MELVIIPEDSFNQLEKKELNRIINFAEYLLKKEGILLPQKIYFYTSFSKFIKKVLPEVKNYGFNEKIAVEIIKCALNNGTYGTINFKEDSIIEMNFNPFNGGEYSSLEFLELIIHESLHLNLSKEVNRDINQLKFKFNQEKFIGNEKVIQLDEGYAEFMTNRILKGVNIKEIKSIKIPISHHEKPKYKKNIDGLNIKLFDKNFERLLLSNREKGSNIFKQRRNLTNKEILEFAKTELIKILYFP